MIFLILHNIRLETTGDKLKYVYNENTFKSMACYETKKNILMAILNNCITKIKRFPETYFVLRTHQDYTRKKSQERFRICSKQNT